jgi:hypothetical protein
MLRHYICIELHKYFKLNGSRDNEILFLIIIRDIQSVFCGTNTLQFSYRFRNLKN